MSWIATLLSVIGIILNAKKNIYCWPTWILSDILWVIIAILKQDYAQVLLWLIFGIAGIYGWWKWKHE